MKTIAGKNKGETELHCAPSNIRCERERAGKSKGTAGRIALGALCIVAGWFVTGLAKEIIADPHVTTSHILTVILILRWLCVKRVSTLKTIILIIIITAIF